MIDIAIMFYIMSLNLKNAIIEPGDCFVNTNMCYNSSGLHTRASTRLRRKIIFNQKNFTKFSYFIEQTAKTHHIEPQLVKAVIVVESKFNPVAGSHRGAQGLMQLMAGTAEEVGVLNRLNPYQNIEGGIKYLRKMLDRFDDNVTLALAAYNAGPGKVLEYQGIPPYTETQDYVKKVLSARNSLLY